MGSQIASRRLSETACNPLAPPQVLAARNTDQSSLARRRSGVVMLITHPRMSRFTRA
jgi:hypothetical protein